MVTLKRKKHKKPPKETSRAPEAKPDDPVQEEVVVDAQPQADVAPAPPDPEVFEQGRRRVFSAKYKLRILQEADACVEPGEIGALLRREGLYSSHLTSWRRQRDEGALRAMSSKRRGPKPRKNPLAKQVQQLERENARLRQKLEQAETIIAIQKKVAALLGNPIESPESDDNG